MDIILYEAILRLLLVIVLASIAIALILATVYGILNVIGGIIDWFNERFGK